MTKSNKKYYWLKLKEDFFEEDTIAWIEEQENGKEYCLFYLKLCLKSLKTNGLLIRNVGSMLVPYDEKTLAKVTNTDTDTVIVAMELFKRIGLVQILENGEIYMAQLQNMVGSETSKAQLMRNKREKDKLLLQDSNNVTNQGNNVTKNKENCYTEIEKEKEKETEQDIDIEQEKETDIEKEQQHIYRKNVVDNILIFFSDLNEKDIDCITNEFFKTNKDIYYLIEKLLLAYDSQSITNKVGYLIKALKDDYKINFVTSLDNLIIVWEDELDRNENDPIIKKRVEYYKYKKLNS